MVHLAAGVMPQKLRYSWADLQSAPGSSDPDRQHVYRGHDTTAEIGKQWIVHGNELAASVPSVLIPIEDNVLLNPIHPDYGELVWKSEPFEWDSRLAELVARSAKPGS